MLVKALTRDSCQLKTQKAKSKFPGWEDWKKFILFCILFIQNNWSTDIETININNKVSSFFYIKKQDKIGLNKHWIKQEDYIWFLL